MMVAIEATKQAHEICSRTIIFWLAGRRRNDVICVETGSPIGFPVVLLSDDGPPRFYRRRARPALSRHRLQFDELAPLRGRLEGNGEMQLDLAARLVGSLPRDGTAVADSGATACHTSLV
jgi:hypothetical protein